ncbi:hypothetical protein [Streptomyces sp. NPDC001889]
MAKVIVTDHFHDHSGEGDRRRSFSPPTAASEPYEHGVSHSMVAQLYDVALDGCAGCRQTLLDHIAEDASTTASVVAWACLITSETYGELPEDLIAEHVDEQGARGEYTPAPAFRELARVYEETERYPDLHERVRERCAAMSADERRRAADSAVTIAAGLTDVGIDFL